MKREIKFRAWDEERQKMVFNPVYVNPPNLDINSVFRGSTLLWMQFTGLKDKNGKECYEGDVVYFEEPTFETEMLKCPIVFHEGSFCAKQPAGYIPVWDFMEDFEVIGNIHENPELIK